MFDRCFGPCLSCVFGLSDLDLSSRPPALGRPALFLTGDGPRPGQVGGLRAREAELQSTLARAKEQTDSRERMFADMKVGEVLVGMLVGMLGRCWAEGGQMSVGGRSYSGQMLAECCSNGGENSMEDWAAPSH